MSIVNNNPLLKGASGMLGGNFVYKQWRGRIIMANKPAKRKGNSARQQQQVDRFREAIDYAKQQMANPERKALYEKGINDRKFSANAVALSDRLHAPKIHEIGAMNYSGEPGEIIRIRATDDFMVASVSVTITGGDNQVVEAGEARPRGKRGLWRMTTTVRNTHVPGTVIAVEAKDMAGNETLSTLTIRSLGLA
jgi:hypothetical protein